MIGFPYPAHIGQGVFEHSFKRESVATAPIFATFRLGAAFFAGEQGFWQQEFFHEIPNRHEHDNIDQDVLKEFHFFVES